MRSIEEPHSFSVSTGKISHIFYKKFDSFMNLNRKIHKRLLSDRLFVYLGFAFIKTISSTYRIKIVHPEIELNILKKGFVPIYASWHQRFFPGITFFATRRPISIMISQSRDGELIANIANLLGWHAVRGSSSRDGIRALHEIREKVRQGYKVGHIVDGPRGPFGVVKPGLLKIAQYSEMPILPTIISSQRKWIFNSWDRFMIPKPFSRVIISFGDEIYIPKHLKNIDFEDKRLSIESVLYSLYLEADEIWKNPKSVKQPFNN